MQMGKLQDALDKSLANLPRLGIENIIREKLSAAGVEDEELVGQVADVIGERNTGHFTIESLHDIAIDFTEADLARLEKTANALNERIPEIVDEMANRQAEKLAQGLKQQWQDSVPATDKTHGTRARILADWSEPLEALRMLLELCRQEGDAFNITFLKSKHPITRNEALARLHIRACRIAEEILLLIENGHTEGAQARWRTLHEVTITATLIAHGGDALAERYFDHQAIELKRALDDHNRATLAAGGAPLSQHQAAGIEREHDRAIARYKSDFRGMYGWASGQLGIPKDPKFHHLQDAAGSLSLKLRYRLSSFDTHASPRTLKQPVHHWDPTTHIPGSFAAGFEGPGADTVQAIVQITSLLFDEPWDLDRLVFALALTRLGIETAETWHRTARQIGLRAQRALDRAVRRPGPTRRFGYVKAKPGERRV